MDKVFIVVAMIAMIGVVLSLGAGLFAMGKGTEKAHQASQRMMQLRVTCQAVALIALFLAYLSKH